MNSRVFPKLLKIAMDSRGQEKWWIMRTWEKDLRALHRTQMPHFRVFFAMMKSPKESASRIPEFKTCSASVSSSELSAHQTSGALAGKVQSTSIEPTGLEAGGSDGCSLFGLTSVPSVS